MKYSPKYKIKSLKTELISNKDEILSLKEQLMSITEQNHILRRKLQFSQSNSLLISEEFHLKSQLTNEEFSALTQNNVMMKSYIQNLQDKLHFISHSCFEEKSQKEIITQELMRFTILSGNLSRDKAFLEEKLAKKIKKLNDVLKECDEFQRNNLALINECEDLKKRNENLSKENKEYEDKLYKIQEKHAKEENTLERDQNRTEKNLIDLQRRYEKLFEEYSALDRMRDSFLKQKEQDNAEINAMSTKLKIITAELIESKESLKKSQNENVSIKQDIRNLVMVLSSGNDKYPFMLDIKSDSQELLLLKSLIIDLLKNNEGSLKKQQKILKNQNSLLEDYRNLQEKLSDLKPSMTIYQSPPHLKEVSKEKENDIVNEANKLSPYKASFFSDAKSHHLGDQNRNNPIFLDNITTEVLNKNNTKYIDFIMIIGALLQILNLINVKFQWKRRIKHISQFSINYFTRIHEYLTKVSEDFGISKMKTPNKAIKNAILRRRNLRKLRKVFISVFFVETLLGYLKNQKIYQGDPGFFKAKFRYLGEDHILNIAKNPLLLNNMFLNEIYAVFQDKYKDFTELLNNLILIDVPKSPLKNSARNLNIDCSIIDIDFCNLNRLFMDKVSEKSFLKYNLEIESRVRSLNSEKKNMKKKLDERSRRLEIAEKKLKK